jgi:hypothetical protein
MLVETETLTHNMLVNLWRSLRPKIWYATHDAVEQGKVYYVTPERDDPWLVCHPDDLEQIKAMFPNHTFIHVRERIVPNNGFHRDGCAGGPVE